MGSWLGLRIFDPNGDLGSKALGVGSLGNQVYGWGLRANA